MYTYAYIASRGHALSEEERLREAMHERMRICACDSRARASTESTYADSVSCVRVYV